MRVLRLKRYSSDLLRGFNAGWVGVLLLVIMSYPSLHVQPLLTLASAIQPSLILLLLASGSGKSSHLLVVHPAPLLEWHVLSVQDLLYYW